VTPDDVMSSQISKISPRLPARSRCAHLRGCPRRPLQNDVSGPVGSGSSGDARLRNAAVSLCSVAAQHLWFQRRRAPAHCAPGPGIEGVRISIPIADPQSRRRTLHPALSGRARCKYLLQRPPPGSTNETCDISSSPPAARPTAPGSLLRRRGR
jgi:hypothetical protein